MLVMTEIENTAKDQTTQNNLMSELVQQSADQALLRMKMHSGNTCSLFANI